MYQCCVCHQWVTSGQSHSCGGTSTFTGCYPTYTYPPIAYVYWPDSNRTFTDLTPLLERIAVALEKLAAKEGE